jgi:hypothetical protein
MKRKSADNEYRNYLTFVKFLAPLDKDYLQHFGTAERFTACPSYNPNFVFEILTQTLVVKNHIKPDTPLKAEN